MNRPLAIATIIALLIILVCDTVHRISEWKSSRAIKKADEKQRNNANN